MGYGREWTTSRQVRGPTDEVSARTKTIVRFAFGPFGLRKRKTARRSLLQPRRSTIVFLHVFTSCTIFPPRWPDFSTFRANTRLDEAVSAFCSFCFGLEAIQRIHRSSVSLAGVVACGLCRAARRRSDVCDTQCSLRSHTHHSRAKKLFVKSSREKPRMAEKVSRFLPSDEVTLLWSVPLRLDPNRDPAQLLDLENRSQRALFASLVLRWHKRSEPPWTS